MDTAAPPLFGPCLLWPNGWMDQDTTGPEVGLGPGDIVLDPALPKERGTAAPTFRPATAAPNFSAHCSGPHLCRPAFYA